MTPDSVWIVEEGEYSAYQVVAIFAKEEQARKFSEARSESTFRAWPLDSWSEEQCTFVFEFQSDGSARLLEQCSYLGEKAIATVSEGSRGLRVAVNRGPLDRALKIASEYRASICARIDESRIRVDRLPPQSFEIPHDWLCIEVAKVLSGLFEPPADEGTLWDLVRKALDPIKAVA